MNCFQENLKHDWTREATYMIIYEYKVITIRREVITIAIQFMITIRGCIYWSYMNSPLPYLMLDNHLLMPQLGVVVYCCGSFVIWMNLQFLQEKHHEITHFCATLVVGHGFMSFLMRAQLVFCRCLAWRLTLVTEGDIQPPVEPQQG